MAGLRAAGQAAQGRRCPDVRRARRPGRGQATTTARSIIVFDRGGAELMAAIESSRRGAAAALYPRRHGRCARPRRLPDAVRQGRRLGRRTDRRPAFHARADGRRSTPPACARPTSRCMSAPAPSSRCGSTTPTEHTMHAEWGEVPQATADAIAAREARRQHRHDRAAPARNRWRATDRCAPGPARPTSSSRRAIASRSSTCC